MTNSTLNPPLRLVRPVAVPPKRMQGENIICFAKDWDEDPTSNNHVMRLLAEENRVLWLNSIAMRTPDLTSGRDLKKIVRKLRSFLRGPRHVSQNLWVYTPLVLPFPHSRIAHTVNRWILQLTLRSLRRKLGMKNFQLWSFLPNAVEYVGRLGESLVVYYCIDEWSKFTYLEGGKMAAMEEVLCRKADLVFATARSLYERRKGWNEETHLALHGVDHATFSQALDPELPVAPEIARLTQPVLGFFGLIHEWIDLSLIEFLALRHPEWTLVLIGKASVDTSRLAKHPNVHLLGRKAYRELPGFCKGFAVGLIPFAVNELTLNVNPIKLREYMSAGLPVVSTALPEVAYYDSECVVARSYEEFERGIIRVLGEDTQEARRRRSEAMSSETWQQAVDRLGTHAMRVKEKKGLS